MTDICGSCWIGLGILSSICLLFALAMCSSARGARMAYALALLTKWGGLVAVAFGFNTLMFGSIGGGTFADGDDFRNASLVVVCTCILPLGGLGAQLLARRTLKRANAATNC